MAAKKTKFDIVTEIEAMEIDHVYDNDRFAGQLYRTTEPIGDGKCAVKYIHSNRLGEVVVEAATLEEAQDSFNSHKA